MDVLSKGPILNWDNDGKLHERFTEWHRTVLSKFVAIRFSSTKDDEVIDAFLVTCIQEWADQRGRDIINTSKLSEEDKKKPDKLLSILDAACQPRGSHIAAAAEYRSLVQGSDSVPDFCRRVRQVVSRMGIADKSATDILIRNAIMLGVSNPHTYSKCLDENQDTLTPDRVEEIALNVWKSEAQQQQLRSFTTAMANVRSAASLSAAPTQVNKLTRSEGNTSVPQGKSHSKARLDMTTGHSRSQPRARTCHWCGSDSLHQKDECPARKVKCRRCGKIGHYEKVCRAKEYSRSNFQQKNMSSTPGAQVRSGKQTSVKALQYDDAMFNNLCTPTHKRALRPIWIRTPDKSSIHELMCEIDTGAGCNVMPKYLYSQVTNKPLDPPKTRITAYGDHQIHVLGSLQTEAIVNSNECHDIQWQVTDTKGPAILGLLSAEVLGYVSLPAIEQPVLPCSPIRLAEVSKIATQQCTDTPKMPERTNDKVEIPKLTIRHWQFEKSALVNNHEHSLPVSKEYLLKEFSDVFDDSTGVGLLPGGEYHIHLKPNAVPVQHAPRHVPEKRKDAYHAELQRLVESGIISKEDRHTEWINSIVTVEKSDGSLRLCLDPKDLNNAIERNPYYSRKMDEIQAEIGKARGKLFTLVDVKSAYWQVKLDEESSLLTTFNTPWGKYRWLRLPFGLKIASDVFQQRLDAVINQIKHVSNIADDCLVYGSDPIQHDAALLLLLESARLNGIKFNASKMQFRVEQCTFFGEVLTSQGLKPDPCKLDAIRQMSPPQTKAELQSFLGLVNYMKRYSAKLTELSAPLREILKADHGWMWESSQQKSFEQIKAEITSAPVLAYYDPDAVHVIQTDASSKGVGAVLLQEGRPITYVSRALTSTEQNYSNIERELLSVVFGLERLHNFIFGGQITLQTDHKPLIGILQKCVADISPRLQRLMLRVHRYDVCLQYLQGKENVIADALSRISPLPSTQKDSSDSVPLYLLTSAIPATTDRLAQLRIATSNDAQLSQLRHYIVHGWPSHRSECAQICQDFWNYRDELSIEEGLIFKNHRLLVPESERQYFLQKLHTGHLGEEKCLLRARQLVFWPRISQDLRLLVKTCGICQSVRPTQPKQTLFPHEVPHGPFKKLGIDMFEISNAHFLLVADYFSKFPFVRKLNSMHSKTVIDLLKTLFSEHGCPEILFCDQGTAFTSREFQEFADQYGFKVEHSSPRTPNANGFAEAMVGVVKEILSKAITAGEDPHLALQAYRATPFNSDLKSPAEMLYARQLRTQIPVRTCLTPEQEAARDVQQRNKSQQKAHYDRRAREYAELTEQQPVRVQLDPHKRFWTNATVIDRPTPEFPRSYIVQTDDGARYQRNRRWLKPRVTAPDANSSVPAAEAIDVSTPTQPEKEDTLCPRRSSRLTKGKPPERLTM